MAQRGGFWGIVAAVLDALVRSSKNDASKNSGSGSNGGRDQSRAKQSAANKPRLRTTAAPAVESPGQYGADATRDLSAAEIAQLAPSYEPNPDGDPDPGEIVWTWVPYAENDGRGKDRPVLIIARMGSGATAGCYLSTKQHRGFISVGTGAWDSQGRESFLSPERVLRVTDGGMRREGHVLGADAFARAVTQLARVYPMRGQR